MLGTIWQNTGPCGVEGKGYYPISQMKTMRLGQRQSHEQLAPLLLFCQIRRGILAVLGTESRSLHMLGEHSTTELRPQPPFVSWTFKQLPYI
jgi:hypothetical protein